MRIRSKQPAPAIPRSKIRITENQRQILLRLFAGSREDEIAAATDRKPSTIFNTVRRVRAQLGARTEYDLLRECLRRRIVDLDEILALTDERWNDPPAIAGDLALAPAEA